MSEVEMVRKPSPELDALKEIAKQSEDRLQAALRHLQKALHADETPGDGEQPPYRNGRGH